jgi:FkbM family methyltransferase
VLLIEKGMYGATGNIYSGLTEFEDMMFVLHVLREGDSFGDVGANVGVFTVLASANAGARSLAVEPAPSTARKLRRNIELNEITARVTILPFVAGSGTGPGSVSFTQNMDSINHVVRTDELFERKDMVEVAVKTLDEMFSHDMPALVKIDVEGFEGAALAGAEKILGSDGTKALIIELNGSGAVYGFTDAQIHELLVSYRFSPYSYEPFTRLLTPMPSHGKFNNTIYVKDLEWITKRARTARKFKVFGQDV